MLNSARGGVGGGGRVERDAQTRTTKKLNIMQ